MRHRGDRTYAGVAVLALLGTVPLIVWGAHWAQEREAAETIRARDATVVLPVGGARVASGPTEGMTLGDDGFGTVLSAPEAIADAAEDGARPSVAPFTVADDVRRFVRGLPAPAPSRAGQSRTQLCTLEGPPSWTGRLVLVNGCLRLHIDGEAGPGPLILGATELHRDAQGYLAASLGSGQSQGEVRVGAPNVMFTGVGCSMDRLVPAPPAFAKVCGVSQMRRVGTMQRRRYCTPRDAAEEARLKSENAATQARVAARRQQCLDRGTDPGACPPGVAPMPPPPPPPGSPVACVPRGR